MDKETALGIVEQARREQSCELADGLIDDLIPYWAVVERAFKNIIDDETCNEALEALEDDEDLEAAYDGEHGPFLMALMIRYRKDAKAKAFDAEHADANGKHDHAVTTERETLASEYPDVAEFIEHGLYEAFSVPDAYGTFDLVVYPDSCEVTSEYLNEAGNVTGYVTRDEGRVTDVRYAEATTNNIHLIIRQSERRPFEWDAIESPDHDALRREGALPEKA